MQLTLLGLPDEILQQICGEILGGAAILREPIATVGLTDQPAFYTCRKLHAILLEILYKEQAYTIYIHPVGISYDRAIHEQEQFLRHHSHRIQRIHFRIHPRSALINDFLSIRSERHRHVSYRYRTRQLTEDEVQATCIHDLTEVINQIQTNRVDNISKLNVTLTSGIMDLYCTIARSESGANADAFRRWSEGDNEYFRPRLEPYVKDLSEPFRALEGMVHAADGRILYDNDVRFQGGWVGDIVRDLVMA